MEDRKTADYYRALAERILATAVGIKDPDAKTALLEIASRYDWLAEWAERHHRSA